MLCCGGVVGLIRGLDGLLSCLLYDNETGVYLVKLRNRFLIKFGGYPLTRKMMLLSSVGQFIDIADGDDDDNGRSGRSGESI